jgi:hypothetical protein
MTGGNAERGIAMLVEVAVIAAKLPALPLRPMLLVVLFALFAVRLIFPRVGHDGGRHGGDQEQGCEQP